MKGNTTCPEKKSLPTADDRQLLSCQSTREETRRGGEDGRFTCRKALTERLQKQSPEQLPLLLTTSTSVSVPFSSRRLGYSDAQREKFFYITGPRERPFLSVLYDSIDKPADHGILNFAGRRGEEGQRCLGPITWEIGYSKLSIAQNWPRQTSQYFVYWIVSPPRSWVHYQHQSLLSLSGRNEKRTEMTPKQFDYKSFKLISNLKCYVRNNKIIR